MTRSLAACALAAVLAAPAWTPIARADAPSFSEIEESLTCQCGCGLTVHSCNHLQCPSAIPLRAEIREQLALAKTKDGILEHFREKYGEKILSAPTTSGFNLIAWVLPFLAVGLGGVLIVIVVRGWVARRRVRAASESAPAPGQAVAGADAYQKVLERELRELDG